MQICLQLESMNNILLIIYLNILNIPYLMAFKTILFKSNITVMLIPSSDRMFTYIP